MWKVGELSFEATCVPPPPFVPLPLPSRGPFDPFSARAGPAASANAAAKMIEYRINRPLGLRLTARRSAGKLAYELSAVAEAMA